MKQRTKAAAILKLIHYIADTVTLAVAGLGRPLRNRAVRQYWESLTPAERAARRVPARLLTTSGLRKTDHCPDGSCLVSEDAPRLIEWNDRGYRDFVDFS
jgi:hypothetical protein